MRAAFVTHSGPSIGLGHLRRCLTLARACRDRGANVGFVLAPGSDGGSVRAHGFELHEELASFRPHVVVADSYDLDAQALAGLRGHAPTGPWRSSSS
jgi:spore coat polysaccharide biosynthesis predicted glycosyltransferase SpsG